MKVRLLFFAVLRDIAGVSERQLELPVGAKAEAVWHSLRKEFPQLADYNHPPMTAINESYASPDSELHDGDDLAFIPPIAGG